MTVSCRRSATWPGVAMPAPHSLQNRAGGRFAWPHFGQGSSGEAHSLQNLAPTSLAKPHFGQCMAVDRLVCAHGGLTCAHGLLSESGR